MRPGTPARSSTASTAATSAADGAKSAKFAFAAGLDGYWIIRFGTHGMIGLELRLALLLVPVGIAWRRQKLLGSLPDRALVVALMAIVAMRAVDLLPNGWWNCLPSPLRRSR